jgi:hypothetical protein
MAVEILVPMTNLYPVLFDFGARQPLALSGLSVLVPTAAACTSYHKVIYPVFLFFVVKKTTSIEYKNNNRDIANICCACYWLCPFFLP